ncbi:MAG: hypothetical protein Fur0043_28200 [Anaerolineales bacterium]
MDSPAELLRQAILAARSGRELTARDLFQDVVRLDPGNEVAWMWLSGLLDPLEDRLAACEQVLFLNPRNAPMRAYYEKLLAEQETLRQRKREELEETLAYARAQYKKKDYGQALLVVQELLQQEIPLADAWLLYAKLITGIDEKVQAYETALRLEPSNAAARQGLEHYRRYQQEPHELAAYLEEEGRLDEALAIYQEIAAKATNSSDFDRAYREMVRLEDLKIERIRHVRPIVHITRLSIGLPLLYVLLVLLQEGLNPFAYLAFYHWTGVPFVVLGSFFIAVAAVRSHHTIWQRLFRERGRGSAAARWTVALAGWILVLLPHLLLLLDSFARLAAFQPPPLPNF